MTPRSEIQEMGWDEMGCCCPGSLCRVSGGHASPLALLIQKIWELSQISASLEHPCTGFTALLPFPLCYPERGIPWSDPRCIPRRGTPTNPSVFPKSPGAGDTAYSPSCFPLAGMATSVAFLSDLILRLSANILWRRCSSCAHSRQA